jgi:hypothetical protein
MYPVANQLVTSHRMLQKGSRKFTEDLSPQA